MIQYINHIIVPYTRDEPTLLVIDCYESHLTSSFLQHAHAHNIRVATVPSSTTFLHQPLDVGVFNTIKCKWRHDWDQALNDWFDERPHTQPPSSSLNHAIALLSPILHHLKSSQIIRSFKHAWSEVFRNIQPMPTIPQSDTTTTTSSDTNILPEDKPFQPIFGPFPYHWVDPYYKPKVSRLLVPATNEPNDTHSTSNSSSTIPASTTPHVSPVVPSSSPPTIFVCNQCHSNITYHRYCHCTTIAFCVQCLSLTWKCPLCLSFTCIQKV
jgi:hypothetical protein